MAKIRIYARVLVELKLNVAEQAEKLGMSMSDYFIQALEAHIGRFNALQQLKVSEQQVAELRKECDLLEKDKISLTTERDEFEKQLHDETDAYNKCYARAESLKKERDTFKAKFEAKGSELEVCEEKVRLLLGRGLWDRIVNALPWIEPPTNTDEE